MDKMLESLSGYIMVLPGCFSGYRWEALREDEKLDEMGPLWQHYFRSMRMNLTSCYDANMYLAEDRILCLAIVSKPGH